MISKRYVVAGLVACALFSVLGLGVLVWKPVALGLQLRRAEGTFGNSYAKGASARLMMTDIEWVLTFEGRCGLSSLQRLAADPSISAAGKAKVATLMKIIRHGGHVPAMRTKYESSRWPWSSYGAYVLKMNQDVPSVVIQPTVAGSEAREKGAR